MVHVELKSLVSWRLLCLLGLYKKKVKIHFFFLLVYGFSSVFSTAKRRVV